MRARGTGADVPSHPIRDSQGVARRPEDEIETFLTIGPAQLARLAQLLGCEPGVDEVLCALEDRYRGESSATTQLRAVLDEHGIAYDCHII